MMKTFKYPATAFTLFLLVFSLLTQFGIASFFAILNSAGYSLPNSWILWITILIQLFTLLLPLLLWLHMTKDSFKKNMPNRPLGILNILLIIVISFVMQPVGMFISSIGNLFFVNDAAVMLNAMADQPWWLLMLAIAVTPGIVEELLFRGYIQTKTKGSVIKIVLLNGFLFGVIHLSPHQFMYTFVLGMLFAYMVHITKSIWAGIIPHFLLNGTQATIAYFASSVEAVEDSYIIQNFAQGLYDAFLPTSPQLAESVYQWGLSLNIATIGIFSIGIIAIFAAFALAGTMVAFTIHNNKRNKGFKDVETTEISHEEAAVYVYRRIDWCLIGIVVLFLLIVVVPIFM